MTTASILVATIAGAAGALLRHELTSGRELHALHVVNVVGSLLLGIAIGLEPSAGLAAVAVGGLGGMTSFSTWMVGAHDLASDDAATDWRALVGHVLVPATLAVGAAAVGLFATHAVRG